MVELELRKAARCTVLNNGALTALMAGNNGATRHETLDAMFAHWMSDPVHGSKSGYTQLAI